MGRLGLSGNIHQAGDADGVVGERSAYVQVREADAIDGVLCLEVELCIEGSTSEDDGAAFAEGEVLLDELLYGNVVGALAHGVGTEHLHSSFIIIVGTHRSASVQGDVVARLGIHE